MNDHFYNEFIDLEQPNYDEFLKKKRVIHEPSGFVVDNSKLWKNSFGHQKALTKYALRKGRAGIFSAVGTGKTIIIVDWSRIVNEYTEKPVLILSPLYIAYQTKEIAKNLMGIDINYIRSPDDIEDGINIVNYEMLHKFQDTAHIWGGVAADESSIFKGADSKTFLMAKKVVEGVAYRSCYSATPNPNSTEEIGKQAEWLAILTMNEMRSTFFVNRQKKKGETGHAGGGWQLMSHASKGRFYRWLASWAIAMNLPSDLGFSDEGYILPPKTEELITIKAGYVPEGQLIFIGLKGVSDRAKVRRATLEARCSRTAEIVNASDEQYIIWCSLNPEADLLAKLIKDGVNVQGSDSTEKKIDALRKFTNGEIRVLISKTKICGNGSNFQNCHNMIWCGLTDSFEAFHQGNGRIYRFMQLHKVKILVIISEEEEEIYWNVKAKEAKSLEMTKNLIESASQYQKDELAGIKIGVTDYAENDIKTDKYHLVLGDTTERIKELPDNSVHLSVYSPPFENLFVYSASERDLGNSGSRELFYTHYGYIVEQLLRVTMPGRKTCVHAADIHARKGKDGFMGVKDFTGDVVRLYVSKGWEYNGRIPIAKNPQATAIRTKAHDLMFVTMKRDSAKLMPVQPDYILIFTKPGKNPIPIRPIENGEMNEDTWIKWAGLTWDDIRETEVLPHKLKGNKKLNEDDTKHICPLQLAVPERCIKLWSNPKETVFDPFLGIGTTVYQAVMFGRYGIGIELKPEYFNKAYQNVEEAVRLTTQEDLFSMAGKLFVAPSQGEV